MGYKELQDWIIAVRDEILYPIANDPQNSLSRIAEGLGQESVGLLGLLNKEKKKIMSDEDYIKRVRTLSVEELLDEVFENPNYLTDGYYNDLGNALYARYLRLKDKGNPPPTVEYRNGY